MTDYLTAETSQSAGEPTELYLFRYGELQIAITSGDREVVHAGVVYTPDVIKRDLTQLAGEMNKSILNITVQKNNEVPGWFIPGAPFEPVNLTLFRQHTLTSAAEGTFIVAFKGRVTRCRFTDFEATLSIEPISTSLRRAGLRRVYETTCTHGLYDTRCGVNKDNKAVQVDLNFLDGRKTFSIVSAAVSQPVGYYIGGMLKIEGVQHMISDHRFALQADADKFPGMGVIAGTTHILVLVRHLQKATVTGTILAYPGCDLLVETCRDRFNNLDNYGGFPFMANTNPFTSDTVQW